MNPLTSPTRVRLDSHFLACSAIFAGVGTFTMSQAEAAVVYSGVANIPIFQGGGGLYLDFQTGDFAQGDRTTVPNWDFNPYTSGTRLYVNAASALVLAGSNVASLPSGTVVDATSNLSALNFVGDTDIAAGTTGFIGFRFKSNDATTDYYGWAEYSVGAGVADGAIVRWAYEDSGAGIAVGAVPEASSLGLLALGSVGLAQWRRRRAA